MLYVIPDAALQQGGYIIESRAVGILSNIPPAINFLTTGGYTTYGDGGGGSYKRSNAAPSHNGYFQSADGAFWVLSDNIANAKQFGAIGDGSVDDLQAILDLIAYCPNYGTVCLTGGIYGISNEIVINKSNITIDLGGSVIIAMPTTQFEYMLVATNQSNIKLVNGIFDANYSNRNATQSVRYCAAAFLGCTDCLMERLIGKNCLGYNGTSAVVFSAATQSVRCNINACMAQSSGIAGASPATDSDAFFTSGEQNVIDGCIAVNCTDTGFVIESSNQSVVSGCTARNCGSVCGITNANDSDKFGNIIDGVTGFDWKGAFAVEIGTLSGLGGLLQTTISNLTLVADVGGGFGTGLAMNIVSQSAPNGVTNGVSVNNVRIYGATTQGIVVQADCNNININGCVIGSTTDPCIYVLGGLGHVIQNCIFNGPASSGVAVNGVSTAVEIKNCTFDGVAVGITSVVSTVTIWSVFNNFKSVSSSRYDLASGTTLNSIGLIDNTPVINNANGSAPTGTLVNKYPISAIDGTILGYVPIYNG